MKPNGTYRNGSSYHSWPGTYWNKASLYNYSSNTFPEVARTTTMLILKRDSKCDNINVISNYGLKIRLVSLYFK